MAHFSLAGTLFVYLLVLGRLTLEWEIIDPFSYSTPREGEIAGYVNGVAYTYMTPSIGLPKQRLLKLYDDMIIQLGKNNSDYMDRLQNESDNMPKQVEYCYLRVYATFMGHCYPSYVYGGLRRFKQMFVQACKLEWLTSDQICDCMIRLCKDF